jgi:hypothetical protein
LPFAPREGASRKSIDPARLVSKTREGPPAPVHRPSLAGQSERVLLYEQYGWAGLCSIEDGRRAGAQTRHPLLERRERHTFDLGIEGFGLTFSRMVACAARR